jgi:hypothetical protein
MFACNIMGDDETFRPLLLILTWTVLSFYVSKLQSCAKLLTVAAQDNLYGAQIL